MWYWVFRVFVVIIMRVCFRLKIEGRENIPQKTNFIVVANHSSFLDPFVIGTAIPKKINWIALRELYHIWWTGWFVRITEVVPAGKVSDKLVYLVEQGKNVGIFPEGTRTHDGGLKEFRRGAALLAVKTGRPLLPCAVTGTYEALPRNSKFPKLKQLKVKIGKPKYLLKEFDSVIDDVALQNGIHDIKNIIKEMMHAG